MRKIILLLLASIFTLALIGCNDSNDVNKDEKSNQEESSNKENKKDSKEDENIEESEIGKLTIEHKDKDLDENAKSGPINININAVQISHLEVEEDQQYLFDDREEVTVIALKISVENTSEDTMGIYPDQGTITTNAGDQIDADMFLSDSIGGDFYGEVKKEGDVVFILDTPANEIKEITYILDAAHDEDFDSSGDNIKMSVPID